MILILIAAFISILAIIFIPIVLKKSAPIFVYVMCLVWLGIFFLGLKQLRYALICGIIFGNLISIFAAIALIKGLNPLAQKGLQICPFCVLGLITNLAIVFLSLKELLNNSG